MAVRESGAVVRGARRVRRRGARGWAPDAAVDARARFGCPAFGECRRRFAGPPSPSPALLCLVVMGAGGVVYGAVRGLQRSSAGPGLRLDSYVLCTGPIGRCTMPPPGGCGLGHHWPLATGRFFDPPMAAALCLPGTAIVLHRVTSTTAMPTLSGAATGLYYGM